MKTLFLISIVSPDVLRWVEKSAIITPEKTKAAEAAFVWSETDY
jgi:hypothetical protein